MPHDDGRHLAALGEAAGEMVSDTSVTPEQWGSFLCGIFDEWKKADIGKVFVQIFDSMLANWVGVMPGTCIFQRNVATQVLWNTMEMYTRVTTLSFPNTS